MLLDEYSKAELKKETLAYIHNFLAHNGPDTSREDVFFAWKSSQRGYKTRRCMT